MTLAEIVAITGMPGIYKVVSRRNDGLIAQSLESGQTAFIPARTHLFTSLDTITIYTQGDGIELRKVFSEMLKQQADRPVPDGKGKDDELKQYIAAIIPDYDQEKVYVSDMKKMVKWFHLLSAKGWMEELVSETAENKAEIPTEVKKEEPRKKASGGDGGQKAIAKPAPVKKITTPRKAS